MHLIVIQEHILYRKKQDRVQDLLQ